MKVTHHRFLHAHATVIIDCRSHLPTSSLAPLKKLSANQLQYADERNSKFHSETNGGLGSSILEVVFLCWPCLCNTVLFCLGDSVIVAATLRGPGTPFRIRFGGRLWVGYLRCLALAISVTAKARRTSGNNFQTHLCNRRSDCVFCLSAADDFLAKFHPTTDGNGTA